MTSFALLLALQRLRVRAAPTRRTLRVASPTPPPCWTARPLVGLASSASSLAVFSLPSASPARRAAAPSPSRRPRAPPSRAAIACLALLLLLGRSGAHYLARLQRLRPAPVVLVDRPRSLSGTPAISGGGRGPVQDPQEQLVDQLRGRPAPAATSRRSRCSGSAIASPIVGPLTSAMTGPSCRPLARSHSQALSRAGRPKVVRKPLGSSTPESGSSAARVPGGDAGDLRHRASDAIDGVVEHLGRQPPGEGVRVVDLVVLVPLVRRDRELIRPRLADQPHRRGARRSRSGGTPRSGSRAARGSSAGCRRGCRRSAR